MKKETVGQNLNDSWKDWKDWEDEEPTHEEGWEEFLDLLRCGKVYFWE